MTQTPLLDRAGCEAVVRRMWPFLDGAIPEHDRERVVTHLAQCANCRSHYDYADAFLRAVGATRPPDDEDRLRALVLSTLEGEGFRLGTS